MNQLPQQIANFPFNFTILDHIPPQVNLPNQEDNNNPNNNNNNNNGASSSSSSLSSVPWCLPLANHLRSFEHWFNQATFSDLRFSFPQTNEIIHVHKVVLSRAIPMRNFLLLQGDSFHTIVCPPGFHAPRVAQVLQMFYCDGDAVNIGRIGLSPLELEYVQLLFGQADSKGFINCRPLRDHFPSLRGVKRFSDGLWVKRAGDSVPIHRILLSVRSQYFQRAFETGLQETFTKRVQLPDVSDDIAAILLKFVYFDPDPQYLDPEVVLEMLYLADRLQIPELRQLCVEEICRGVQDGSVDTDNVLPILEASLALNIPDIKEACLRLAVTNFLQLQEKEDFVVLSKELKRELTLLSSLQNNPLRSRTIGRTREIIAILKESLEIQEARLEQVRSEFEHANANLQEEGEEELKPEVREGRMLFGKHWEQLIRAQERRVNTLRNYLDAHIRIFE